MRSLTLTLCAIVLTLAFFPTSARASDTGAVRGIVVDRNAHPVVDAAVTLQAENSAPLTMRTGADGKFSFPQVPFDTYTVTASAPGLSGTPQVVTVASGSVVNLSIVLGTAVLGHVTVHGVAAQQSGVSVVSGGVITTLPGNTSLNKVIETVPGIVPFSYNEPIARGYHGVAYEIDGVPMPQTTSSGFAELIDPRDVARMEVFTGAMPAEFGGERMGAVVDIVSRRPSKMNGDQALFSESVGSYGSATGSLAESVNSDRMSFFLSGNTLRTNRGIDSPTFVPQHDKSNEGDEFLRLTAAPNARDTFSFDFVNQFSGFQIPINTNQSDPLDPQWSLPGTDDNQREYYRSVNVVYNRASADGKGYFELAPWFRSNRVTYSPDPANDLGGQTGTSVSQDRIGKYVGITTAFFQSTAENDYKVGFTASMESFQSTFSILTNSTPPFFDNIAQRGSNFGIYAEDQYTASSEVQVNFGLRYDHSTGFTSGHAFSPRIEIDDKVTARDTLHVYYGRTYAAPSLEDVRKAAVIFSGPTPPPTLPVYDLKPETDSIYEAGIAHRFSDAATGSLTLWVRNVWNVLDTTQLASTPIFTVFNSTLGQAEGVEMRVQGRNRDYDTWYLSYGLSQSLAEGVSGGEFLFPPVSGPPVFSPEDHDQTNTLNTAYSWGYGRDGRGFTTLQTTYGSGFPVQFFNGPSRLTPHVEVGAAVGVKAPSSGAGLGWELQGTNLLNKQYLLKSANGFNTTQWATGRQVTFTLSEAIR